ncbi:hypothetical protein BXZ70DRAFT_457299 [Cristinia sonorae]|uniref:Uncharacterized protein n=1 Tax=Cristinia sonorae TaxID=1940300 RepID=A0A8K0XM30_9AGAR|nr:hypothetical protein BXZ70DRAFT_457299 [Cristinia sonorae]
MKRYFKYLKGQPPSDVRRQSPHIMDLQGPTSVQQIPLARQHNCPCYILACAACTLNALTGSNGSQGRIRVFGGFCFCKDHKELSSKEQWHSQPRPLSDFLLLLPLIPWIPPYLRCYHRITMSSESVDSGLSTRIPSHLKGKGRAREEDGGDAGLAAVSCQSNTTTAVSSVPSPAPTPEVANVVRLEDGPAPSVNTESTADPPTVVRSWGGTPHVCSILTSGGIQLAWLHHVHLNGSFYNVSVDSHRTPLAITPDDVKDPAILQKFNEAVQAERAKIHKAGITVPGPYFDGSEIMVARDLTNIAGPTTFWLCMKRCLRIEVFPKDRPDKDVVLEHKTSRFWDEVAAYPMHLIQLPFNAEVDFLGALSFGSNERITEWNDTSFPFTDLQSQRLVKVYRSLKKELDRNNTAVVPALAWHIARTMSKIEDVRSRTQFGTSDFQLYRPVATQRPRFLVRAAEAFLMVGAHRMYRVRLQHARVQGSIYLSDFRELLGNLLAEWSDSNLLATVFIGANIAFLAVPDITNIQRNASLTSIICALISVLTGVHHVWLHRTKINASYEEAKAYLEHIQPLDDGRDSDLAVTAWFLSIPLVSLLYSVLSFAIAIAAFCIQNNDTHGKMLLVVVLGILGVTGLITLLFFWHVWRGPRAEVSEEEIDDVLGYGWKVRLGRTAGRVGRFARDIICTAVLLRGKEPSTQEKDITGV